MFIGGNLEIHKSVIRYAEMLKNRPNIRITALVQSRGGLSRNTVSEESSLSDSDPDPSSEDNTHAIE